MRLLPLLLLSLACGDKSADCPATDNTTDGGDQTVTDVDQDGFPAAVDCNDGDANTYPGAVEADGDGKDANCDGDDNNPATMVDADADGFPATVDCDDADPDAHPGADDAVGDGIDQDCDGADATAADNPDADGDGYASLAFHGTDCDDNDPSVHPDVAETVGDDVDQDCDGADYDASGLTVGELVITEIMYDSNAVSDADGEWFELINHGSHTVNLKGLIVADDAAFGAADIFTVDEDVLIAPGERLVFGVNGDLSQNGQIPVDYDYAGGGVNLNNSADDLLLGVSAGASVTTIDKVSWDELAGWPLAKGISIELSDSSIGATANDDAAAWCLATSLTDSNLDKGSPGEVSSGC